MNRGEACPFSGVIESSQLMVPQREVPVAPFHIGTGTLKHLRERFGLVLELVLLHWAPLAQRPAGRKQRGTEALGQFTQRLACCHRSSRGHALEIIRWNEMRMHGVGLARRQVELTHLLAHIPRDELDGGLHFGHHTLRFLDSIQACLAQTFLLGNGAEHVDVPLDITGNEFPVPTHPALQVDKVVGMANGADALGDLLALLGEAVMLVASGIRMTVRKAGIASVGSSQLIWRSPPIIIVPTSTSGAAMTG